MDSEEVNAIFALGDINGDGQIDMGEFVSLMLPSAGEVARQVSSTLKTLDDVKYAFKLLDKDGDGSIDRKEMASSGHRFNNAQGEAPYSSGVQEMNQSKTKPDTVISPSGAVCTPTEPRGSSASGWTGSRLPVFNASSM